MRKIKHHQHPFQDGGVKGKSNPNVTASASYSPNIICGAAKVNRSSGGDKIKTA